MLLLLLLVTPLVNAVDDSCSTPCTCTLPEPLDKVNSTEFLSNVGTWYGSYSTDCNQTCGYVSYIDIGNNTMNTNLTVTMENECSQTIVTYYGTTTLNECNTLTSILPCAPEYNGDYVILATDCETYLISGHCKPGSCEPIYYIAFSSETPSDCTMNKVKEDLKCLDLCLDNFCYIC